jgi:hypothetical protein
MDVLLNTKHTELGLFKNRSQKKIFGLKKDEMAGRRRELHKEEYHNSYRKQNIMTMNSKEMTLLGHAENMEKIRTVKNLKNLKKEGRLGDVVADFVSVLNYHATKAYRGRGGKSQHIYRMPSFLQFEAIGKRHPSAALPPLTDE